MPSLFPRSLSTLENKVMQVIWSQGPSTAEEVRQALAPSDSFADSTVRTILQRLEGKGFLSHTVDGRTNVYQSLLPRQKAAVHAVRQIINQLCGGSVEDLLVGLVDDEVVAHDDLQELAERISRARRTAEAPRKRERKKHA